jgi:hypothetical protein
VTQTSAPTVVPSLMSWCPDAGSARRHEPCGLTKLTEDMSWAIPTRRKSCGLHCGGRKLLHRAHRGGRLVRQIGVHPICQRDNVAPANKFA